MTTHHRGPVPQFATVRTPDAKHIGVRVNGVTRSDVMAYSVPEGWARVTAQAGRKATITLKGTIEPFWRS